MGDLLFQSSICFVNWSIKSRPVLPYGIIIIIIIIIIKIIIIIIIIIIISEK